MSVNSTVYAHVPCSVRDDVPQTLLATHLSVGRAGPPDESGVIAKGAGVHTHLHLVELGIEEDERVGPVGEDRGWVKSDTCTIKKKKNINTLNSKQLATEHITHRQGWVRTF